MSQSHVTVPALLTTREVAEWLKIHPGSLGNDRASNRGLPFVRIGSRVRYMTEDVASYLAANVVVPASA